MRERTQRCATIATIACGLVLAPQALATPTAWERVPAAASPGRAEAVKAKRLAAFRFDQRTMERALEAAPRESMRSAGRDAVRISVPRPDGELEEFDVVESPVMEPALAARHPEIATYAGTAVENPRRTIRLDVGPLGLNASVLGGDASYAVEPRYATGEEHASYHLRDAERDVEQEALEDTVGAGRQPRVARERRSAAEPVTLRTYRLALVSDHTYAEAHRDPAQPAGTGFRTTAAKVALVNRTSHVLEQEAAFRLLLVAGNDALNLDTPQMAVQAGGPCGDRPCYQPAQLNSCGTAAPQNAVVTGLLVGARNFDIGHIVLARSLGGIARLGSVGNEWKSYGCSGWPTPYVRGYSMVTLFGHELGHQFDGEHTWSACGFQNWAAAGVEPGSGQSLLSYAGSCGSNDLQREKDPYFSFYSRAQFEAYTQEELPPTSSQQNYRLRGFGPGDSYRLTYAGATSEPIAYDDHTADGVRAAIESLPTWPDGALIEVLAIDDVGALVRFGGTLAGVPVDMLGVTDTTGTEAIVGERIAGGPQTNGGSEVEVTSNHRPVVSAPAASTVPARTPFELTATGADADDDLLTYTWEQADGSQNGTTSIWSSSKSRGPLFPMFGTHAVFAEEDLGEHDIEGPNEAGESPARTFPDMRQLLADDTNARGSCRTRQCFSEFLPTAAYVGTDGDRTLHFRVTARDHRPGAAGTGFADTEVVVDPTAGPFRVTAPAPGPVPSGSALIVRWDVASTDRLAERVAVRLSADGGRSFPVVLEGGTPNDGLTVVELPPGLETEAGVLRVEGADGPWFDVVKGLLRIRPTDIAAQTPSLDFGPTKVGARGGQRIAWVVNRGAATATTGPVAVQGEDAGAFLIQDDGCSDRELAPDERCAVRLRFSPEHAGTSVATLSVPSSDAAPPLGIVVSGEGTQ